LETLPLQWCECQREEFLNSSSSQLNSSLSFQTTIPPGCLNLPTNNPRLP
jgi:hypothetical protein